MNFNSYFTIKHTSNLRILLLTLFFIVPLGTIYGQNQSSPSPSPGAAWFTAYV